MGGGRGLVGRQPVGCADGERGVHEPDGGVWGYESPDLTREEEEEEGGDVSKGTSQQDQIAGRKEEKAETDGGRVSPGGWKDDGMRDRP